MRILAIGDSHADPQESNRRYLWAGRLAKEYKPDIIVDIGDWGDFASLCHYDRGQVRAEGRRFNDDMAAYRQAMDLFDEGIACKGYNPTKIKCIGNHEYRMDKAGQCDPAMFGTLTVDNLGVERWGWEAVPFLTPFTVERVNFIHYVKQPGSQKAISGKYAAHHILTKKHASFIFGHDHKASMAMDTLENGRRIMALGVGCFFEHDPEYAGSDVNAWWRGLVMLDNVANGSFNPTFIGMDKIQKEFGGNDDIDPLVKIERIEAEELQPYNNYGAMSGDDFISEYTEAQRKRGVIVE